MADPDVSGSPRPHAMNGLFELIAACGILLIAAGSVLLCIYAFRQSILWGVLCLLVPFALPIFASPPKSTSPAFSLAFLFVDLPLTVWLVAARTIRR